MTINKRRSFITGIKSTKLHSKEKKFLIKYKPWGIILFSRNIKSIKHLGDIFKVNNYSWDDAYSCRKIIKWINPKLKSSYINKRIGKLKLKYYVFHSIFRFLVFINLILKKSAPVHIIKKDNKGGKSFNKTNITLAIINASLRMLCCFVPIKKYRYVLRHKVKIFVEKIS